MIALLSFLTPVEQIWANAQCGENYLQIPHFEEATVKANLKLVQWLAERSKSLATWQHAMLGPTADGTYYYRLGESELWDVDSLSDKLEARKKELLALGFPIPTPEELQSVTQANHKARAQAAPNVVRCAKHFPGGDERIELTEKSPVFFNSISETLQFLKPFQDLLRSSESPTCIMLTHASYRHEAFGASARQYLGPLLPDIPFEEIPASVNPGIVSYLRNQLKFSGVLLSDYALMGSFFTFLKYWPTRGDLLAETGLATVYLATYAGIDLIQSATFREPGTPLGEQIVQKELELFDRPVLEDWDKHLSEWLLDFSLRIGAPLNKSQVEKLSLTEKIFLKSPPFADSDLARFEYETRDVPKQFRENLKVYAYGKDIWSRSGVMTLLQRQFIVENLSREHFASPPKGPSDEKRWFDELMKNKKFQKTYKTIPWGTPQVEDTFCRVRNR